MKTCPTNHGKNIPENYSFKSSTRLWRVSFIYNNEWFRLELLGPEMDATKFEDQN